jgi:hypothetical protein
MYFPLYKQVVLSEEIVFNEGEEDTDPQALHMWKLGNLYTPVSHTLDSWTPFSRISPISRKITYFLF